MAAITDVSDVVNRATGGNSGTPENLIFYKDARVDAAVAVATVAGRYTSLWMYEGNPSGGAAPGASVAIPDNTTTGGLLQADPGGGRTKWALNLSAASLNAGTLILCDRLLHISSLSGTSTSAQTVGGTLTRNTGGVGNFIVAEIYTIIGTTATTITASYTNQAGTSGKTTTATAIGGTGLREAQRTIILPLAAGDYGVQAVASATLAASTTTVGDWGINVVRPLKMWGIPQVGVPGVADLCPLPGPVEIPTDACLFFIWLANSTAAPAILGNLFSIEA